MASVWDDPELKVGGEFVKLENVGDTISGTISVVRPHRFDDGSVAPQLLMTTDSGEEKTLTAGPVRLKQELAEQRPEAGDHVRVTLTQLEPRAGGKTLKHFEVVVTRGGQQLPASSTPAPTSPAPQQPAAPAPAAEQATQLTPEQAAAVAQLSPEQRQQLGL